MDGYGYDSKVKENGPFCQREVILRRYFERSFLNLWNSINRFTLYILFINFVHFLNVSLGFIKMHLKCYEIKKKDDL